MIYLVRIQGKRQTRSDDQLATQKTRGTYFWLDSVRLQTESENTKLLKIQQKEREVESEYLNEKKKMEDTLKKLGIEQKKFELEQKRTTA